MLATVESKTEYLELLTEKSRRQCEASLVAFIEQAWHVVEPAAVFVPNWHIDAIAQHLEAVSRGDILNLLINIPPGCMKSLIASVFWPTWEWTTRPHLRYLCVSFDQGLSTRDNKRVRDLVTSEWYQARWPHVQLADDQNQKTRFNTTAGGWRIATTVRGRGLGEHPHRKIVDDPHNTREAESAVERQTAIDFFDQTLSTRGAALNAATVVFMQRLNEGDLSGHWLATSEPVHVCLPMRFEPRRMPRTPIGWQDPRTIPGELLWPALFDAKTLARLERPLGSYGVAGQMQQRPAPAEGGLLKRHWWQFYRPMPLPRVDEIVLSCDTALKDKKLSDFWAAQAWGRRGADVFLLRSARGRWDLVEGEQQIKDLYRWAREVFPGVKLSVLIENAAAGPDVIAALKRVVPGIIPITPKGDKVQRAFAVTPVIEAGNVWIPGAALPNGDFDVAFTPAWVQDFLAECAAFPNGANDDQVDAMSQALLRLTASTASVASIKVGQRRARAAAPSGLMPHIAPQELDVLNQLVARHGSAAVTQIRRLNNPYFRLPEHLEGIAPGGRV